MQSAGDKKQIMEVQISRNVKAVKMWLLVQVLSEDSKKDEVKDISGIYAVINQDNLIDGETSTTHAEGIVRFIHNLKLSEGKVIYSDVDRLLVEKKLQQLTMKEEALEKVIQKNKRYFLVQFHKDSKDIVQAVLPEKDVSWPTNIDDNQRQVVIHDGVQKRIATVLLCSEDKKMIMTEFQKLRISCFDEGFEENADIGKNITEGLHAVLLYTCGPANVVYTVVNLSETFCQSGNRYSNAVAYLTDGRNVFQGLIVRMSKNVDELYDTLQCIKSHCLCMDFPLDIDLNNPEVIPPKNFQSLCGSVETFERFAGGKPYALLDVQLTHLENRMKEESTILIESLDVLENAKKALLQRLAILEQN